MSVIRAQMLEQKQANRESLDYFKYFANHRRQLSGLITSARDKTGGSLCVLGAGNCFDLELEQLARQFDEVHLVDIDRDAIKGARLRVAEHLYPKIKLHAPVDITCANKKLSSWRDFQVTQEALIQFPESAARTLATSLPGPFDVVVSACVASQLLLTYRRVLGADHPLFEAGLITLLIAHLRTLVTLTKPQGRAHFVTDVSSNEIAPLERFFDTAPSLESLQGLVASGQVFHYLAPELIQTLSADDPFLRDAADPAGPVATWLWQNGPKRSFLVYALTFARR